MRRGAGAALVGVASVGIVAAVGYGVLSGSGPFSGTTDECTAVVDGHSVTLDVEQAENASLITAISVRRGLPARAASSRRADSSLRPASPPTPSHPGA